MTSQFLYSQALQLKDKANKIVTKGVLFGNRYKQAEDLYEQAAIGFKQIQEYQLAGECYEKRAECFEKLNDLKKAASILGTAADCYSQVDFKNTMRVLSKAASLNAQNGKFLIAAQMEKNMGYYKIYYCKLTSQVICVINNKIYLKLQNITENQQITMKRSRVQQIK